MIVLLLIMAGMIAVPLAIEVKKSPDDNLARDLQVEIIESVVQPLERQIDSINEGIQASLVQARARASMLQSLFQFLDLVTSWVKAFLKFFD